MLYHTSSSNILVFSKIQNLKKEHSNLSDQVKTAKDSFLGPPNIVDTLQKLGNEYELLRKKYLQELSDRKRLYNEVIELKGNIRVFCRCRPLNQVEITNGSNCVVEFDSSQDNELQIISSDSSKKQFKFDHVFEPEDNQEAVFAQTKPIVASVLDGYNACIFAYGQTGTGKTFTMEGSPENRGVNYRTLDELFRLSQERSGIMRYGLFVSMMEVYNEKIRDLLIESSNQPPKNFSIRTRAYLGKDLVSPFNLKFSHSPNLYCTSLETRAFAAAASQSTIQIVDKRKIDKKPLLCPSKLRMPLRKITNSMPPPSPLQKQKTGSVLSSMYEKENNPRITTAGTNTKRLMKPRRMSVAIRPPMSAQVFQPKRRVSIATYRSEPTSNMTTPLQTSRYKNGNVVGRQSFVRDPRKPRNSKLFSPLPEFRTASETLRESTLQLSKIGWTEIATSNGFVEDDEIDCWCVYHDEDGQRRTSLLVQKIEKVAISTIVSHNLR
ncbi:KINESIN-LIKE PROTEIN [Salix viminalis]|uniref:KINESIN-LIKE PROTEIN n=1 Tax=Salix viminalis TaxID=40686 RepID=A0A9Q0UWZ1_SALVM|nr:KINESIN-LIKE PROTEIN [Salix viminalis]